MEKDDASRFYLPPNSIRNPACIVIEPIVRINIPSNNLIAKKERVQPGTQVLMTERRPKNTQTVRDKGMAAGSELSSPFSAADQRERWVIPGVIANGVTTTGYALYDFRVFMGVLTQHEEGGMGVVSFQDIQHLWSKLGMRSVVERECHNGVRS
jgi:hypothetical protein